MTDDRFWPPTSPADVAAGVQCEPLCCPVLKAAPVVRLGEGVDAVVYPAQHVVVGGARQFVAFDSVCACLGGGEQSELVVGHLT